MLDEKRSLDGLWSDPKLASLPDNDRALVRAIVTMALRQLGRIDHILAEVLDKPLGTKGAPAQRLLEVGLTQILFMEIADHAAVATTVEVAQANPKLRHFKKLINAILRRVIRERETFLEMSDHVALNTPKWLFDAWVKDYGAEEAAKIAEAHGKEAALDITLKPGADEAAEALGGLRLPTGTVRIAKHHGKITSLPGFEAGDWWVQDAAAALPVKLLGDVAGKSVADLCAAPGGKTAQLAAQGAHVTAIDLSEERLERLAENMERLKLTDQVSLIPCDIMHFEPDELYDAILLDAPCSATGTIRRHPDVPYLKYDKDIIALADLQARLLMAAAEWLKPGGLMVFCTCSLQSQEGPSQIPSFLAEKTDFELVPIAQDELPGLAPCITSNGCLRTLPHHCVGDEAVGIDGFFAARLRRR